MAPDQRVYTPPHSVEQGRRDFKVYMSKLLQRSADLDGFRHRLHLQQRDDPAPADADSPQWGSAVAMLGDETSAIRDPRASPPVAATEAEVEFSSSYFLDKRRWPRAGTRTPVHPPVPPNFSWERRRSTTSPPAPPRQEPQRPPSQSRLERGDSEGGEEMGKALSVGSIPRSDQHGEFFRPPPPPPPVAIPPAATAPPRNNIRESKRRPNDLEGLEKWEEDPEEWKLAWARRLARGPIYTEYRDRFSWPPPDTHSRVTVGNEAELLPSERKCQRRDWEHSAPNGCGVGAETGGQAPGYKQDGGAIGAVDVPAQGRSDFSWTRRPKGPTDAQMSFLGPNSEPMSPPESTRMINTTDGEGGAFVGPAPRQQQPPPFPRERQAGSAQFERTASGSCAVETEMEERQSKAALESRAAEVGSSVHFGARGTTAYGDEVSMWDEDRQRGGGSLGVRDDSAVGMEGRARVGQGGAEGATVWGGGLGYGRGEGVVRKTGGGRSERFREAVKNRETEERHGDYTVDFASQSMLTEYMDEFGWPAELPKPGRRGKRTGMDMDNVERLLAGRPAERADRAPDVEVVSRLGTAVDRALSSVSPTHLSEMCRMRSPPPTARRLVSALVIALGLRWRRWNDVRTQLLGNKAELKGFLRRFDKDRSGLSSEVIRPFVEDPNLAPNQVKQVAVCMLWVSRWLRSLYDYLAVKEGKLEAPTEHLRPSSVRRAAKRHSHRQAHKRPQSLPPRPRASRATLVQPGARSKAVAAAEDADAEVASTGATAALEGATLAPIGATTRPVLSVTPPRRRQEQHRQGYRTNRNEGGEVGSSLALATRGAGSSSVPSSLSATPDGDARASSAGVLSAPGAVGERVDRERVAISRGEEGRGRAGGHAARVGFAGSNTDLASESAWTAGTVTSRGDVMEAATEDQIDTGSFAAGSYHEPLSETRRRREGHSHSATVRGRSGFSRRKGATLEGAMLHEKGSRAVNRGTWSMTSCSDGCLVPHVHKGRTPSHFANPKARRPSVGRHDPILANRRWPPPVEMRRRDRTEQRSAYSLEHSFLSSGRR